MKFIIKKENIFKKLQQINICINNKNNLLILNNILLEVNKKNLILNSTSLDIDIKVIINKIIIYKQGSITVCANKFINIFRVLPKNSKIKVFLKKKKLFILSKNINYSISTLSALDFPKFSNYKTKIKLYLIESKFKKLIKYVKCSMANQDVRYYLNSMLFEFNKNKLKAISTDGHRLSMYEIYIKNKNIKSKFSIIIPKKGIIILYKILNFSNKIIKLKFSKNNIYVKINNYIFNSNLINNNFPNYNFLFKKKTKKKFTINREILKKALTRVSILSNDKLNAVQFYLKFNQLKIYTKNLEEDEAKEKININYNYDKMKISFNVNYMLDALNNLTSTEIRLFFIDEFSNIKIKNKINSKKKITHIIMPIRI